MPATYDKIATTTLGSAAANITFSSIAASWTDLRLTITGKSIAGNVYRIQLNSDTGSNYSVTLLESDGSTLSSNRGTNNSAMLAGFSYGGSATIPEFVTYDIFSYAGSTNKTALVTTSANQGSASGYIARIVGLWRNTAAITSIVITTSSSGDIPSGVTATLYGIKAA
jgi:hypothetical protein